MVLPAPVARQLGHQPHLRADNRVHGSVAGPSRVSIAHEEARPSCPHLFGGKNQPSGAYSKLDQLARFDLAILDELGYVPFDRPAPTCCSASSANATSAAA